MTQTPPFILLFLLGANHALHIGDIVVVYTIDARLNRTQTAKLFSFTLLTHLVNLLLIFLVARYLLLLAPVHLEARMSQITGGIVLLLGCWFLFKRLRDRNRNCTHHAHETEVKNSALFGVGAIGGFIPCGEVIAIGLLSLSAQIFLHNLLGFVSGLVLTLGVIMALGATAGHTLHALRHAVWIRIVTPLLLILIGLYKILLA